MERGRDMTVDSVIDIMHAMFRTMLFLALPSLMSALVVGVIVSVVQTVTSIQEQTMVFVPKMLAVMLSLIVTFSWLLSMALRFTSRIYESIPQMVK